MNCGSHRSLPCAECGKDASWCNVQCKWSEGKCQAKGSVQAERVRLVWKEKLSYVSKAVLSLSKFDNISQGVYFHDICNADHVPKRETKEFDLDQWKERKTSGGLDDKDRKMLVKYYGSANSVFEWGLGESTYMAGYFNVPRYAGIDSDAEWVSKARDKVSKIS